MEEGALVEPRDPASLAKAIEFLLTDNQLRFTCGLAGRRKARQYTEDALTERVARLYRELLAAVPIKG